MTTPSPEEFVRVWEGSSSVLEASDRLSEMGYWSMSPRRTLDYATGLWRRGCRLQALPQTTPPTLAAAAGAGAKALTRGLLSGLVHLVEASLGESAPAPPPSVTILVELTKPAERG